ncbi:MAG: hypothetical protein ACETWG_10945 [Candidatus Neomarinimicrobiota bacterium]
MPAAKARPVRPAGRESRREGEREQGRMERSPDRVQEESLKFNKIHTKFSIIKFFPDERDKSKV